MTIFGAVLAPEILLAGDSTQVILCDQWKAKITPANIPNDALDKLWTWLSEPIGLPRALFGEEPEQSRIGSDRIGSTKPSFFQLLLTFSPV